MIDRLIAILIAAIIAVVVLFTLWGVSYLPFIMVAEAKCYEQGYPKAVITWQYKTYCVNLDGDVTTKVKLTDEVAE